jgi:hypothetical protein
VTLTTNPPEAGQKWRGGAQSHLVLCPSSPSSDPEISAYLSTVVAICAPRRGGGSRNGAGDSGKERNSGHGFSTLHVCWEDTTSPSWVLFAE